jgi:hypothetical protein
MLLKDNNLKLESHPFDWNVQCIDNINDIFIDNFKNFLNKDNYININNFTKNNFYYNNTCRLFGDINVDFQHHNLLNEIDYKYYERCINRINTLNERYEKLIFIMIQPLYINKLNVELNKIMTLFNILINKYGEKMEKLIIFNILEKNNTIYKKELINDKLILVELDTNMIIGKCGMMYFDDSGLEKFLNIIQEI